MNRIDLKPGCYSLPLGSDPLWWLSKHLADTNGGNSMVILPTQRTVNRLQRILYKLNPTLLTNVNIIAYEDLAEISTPLITSQCIVWELAQRIHVKTDLFQGRVPAIDQQQQLASAINSTLTELYTHEVTLNKCPNNFENRELIEIINEYETLLKQHDQIHPADALVQGIKLFHERYSNLQRAVYLIIDGAIPPSLQQLAADLSKENYVFIYGDLPTQDCSGYDPKQCYTSLYKILYNNDIPILPLDLYTHRKPLIDELQKPLFNSTKLSRFFNDIQFIECPNNLSLANDIITLARHSFEKNIKSITVVTPNRDLARVIHMTATQNGISVDDSCGIQLDETLLGSLLLQSLQCIMQPSNYRNILNLISHPKFHEYWGDFPAKLDIFGRSDRLSFVQALRTYIPENEQENDRLLTLIQFINTPPKSLFSTQLSQVLEHLTLWGIQVNEHSESVEILEIAASVDNLDTLEFILKSTPYRTPTPKEHHIQIMGPLEVRLMQPKIVILASLNEGDWPIPASANPWLYSYLRQQIGLPAIDQITGVSSKILLSLLGCQEVYLCRTTHQNGQPIQPSRWWERLRIISTLNAVQIPNVKVNTADDVQTSIDIAPFKIPSELIPRRLSVSDIHLLVNNPQQFILNRILKLDDLPLWEAEPDPRHKGIIVHEVLEMAVNQNLSLDTMIHKAMNKLAALNLSAHEHMFWESQIITNVRNFYRLHQDSSPQHSYAELKGEWILNTRFGSVTLVGKADRIDQHPDGSLQVIDYKTGIVPTKQSVYKGLSPQLPLLGMMMAHGGFKEIPPQQPFMVSYWDLKDGSSVNFLFDEISHLEPELIAIIETLLDPASTFDIYLTFKI
ncbi:MAG: PD-(D/E)XK nuclease family protein [Alphaproteobacteria bacterium]|nr:PD-(D/E)XK nuclease family protein [Alphaproteobacteria bacterium]